MKTIDVTWAEFARGVLLLGRQGENLVSRLRVDVSEQLASHRGATFGLRVCTVDGTVYPAAQVESSGGVVTWNITDTDTARAGEGWAQLVMYGGVKRSPRRRSRTHWCCPAWNPARKSRRIR